MTSFEKLCDRLYIDQSTLSRCLKEVRNKLSQYNLELISRLGYGLKVQGDKLDVHLYMANSSSVHIFTSKEGYKVSFFRLIVVPLCTVFVMMLLPMQYYDIRMTLLIANSTPIGVMLAMFSQMYAGDFEYGARIVSLSTLLSLISIPLVLSMTNILW
ncbi:helix-turn-helix domain-containing protein [Faecalicoccus pleomorphus]|uniref:helix-turn-helix domain-containing protein n=1 Tax=Faecalicoccus pleomorphus TaxID=1323 RepID=UPI001896E817|nr:helix-turn-helix domain-containing protein [Faecalicoccus pleomorphus]MDB7983493.1 helix-turn-helix domain-containing protein [Faecalicoccus pleomorphus]